MLVSKLRIIISTLVITFMFMSAIVVDNDSADAIGSLTAAADSQFTVSAPSFSAGPNAATTFSYTPTLGSPIAAADSPSIDFSISGIQLANSSYYCNDSDPGFECNDISISGVLRSNVSVSASSRYRGSQLDVSISWGAPDQSYGGVSTYVDLNPGASVQAVLAAGLFTWIPMDAYATAIARDNNNWVQVATSYFQNGIFAELPQKTIVFDANGGDGSMYNQASSYATTIRESSFTRNGFAFLGWSTSSTGPVSYLNEASYSFASDTTLFARWAPANSPAMTTPGGFVQGSNPSTISVTWQSTVDMPLQSSAGNATLAFTLNGLQNDPNFSNANTKRYRVNCYNPSAQTPCYGISLSSSSGALANVTKYVSAYSSNSVTFQFWVGLNAIPAGTTFTLTIPSGVVYLASNSFASVYTTDGNTTLETTSNTNFNAALSRSISYDSGGGTSLSSGTFTGNVAQPSTITKAGYSFAGWFAASSGGSALTFPYTPPGTGAVTLYARWTPTSNAVTYDVDGGSAIANGFFNTGGTLTLPSAPTKTGYTFVNWFEAASGGTALGSTFSPSATGPITIYARWSPNSNAVTYDVEGGSSVSSNSFTTGGTLTLPAAPTKSGYAFAGWYASPTGGSPLVSGYSPNATGPITLYAHWTVSSRTVTFDANGGTGTLASQTSGSSAQLTTNTITRTGYGFTGWNTAANGTGTSYAVDATYPFTSSETLYAQWRALPATPVAAVDIQVPVGSAIANAPVDLDVDGLKDQTGYTVTVHSTPQIIDQGTIWSGRLNTTVRIPSNLEAGWHRLVIEGTAADGTPWTEESYFKVSPGGILLATSEVVPAELAMTGSNSVPVFYGAGALIIFGIVFMLANTTLRRRVKRND
jgi:uncharacterized repeat protein (TIGR02543 family)